MVQTPIRTQTLYPDSDGQPMAENTKQYEWIVRLVENLKRLLEDQTAFVAGDLLWYPSQVEPGEQPPRQAPDAMVVLGRPAGHRGSYKQWDEAGIAPQVVFEIISPGNTMGEMFNKQVFYTQHGVLEMYFYDPNSYEFWGLVRETPQDVPTPVLRLNLPWVSPLLGIRFEMFADGLAVFYPNGEPFKTLTELAKERDLARVERDQTAIERNQAQAQRDQATLERDTAQTKLERAIARMRAAGLDPNDL
ncbi:MAG: Uma2 family endonuclease [Spirulinaceae cyanobacterium]